MTLESARSGSADCPPPRQLVGYAGSGRSPARKNQARKPLPRAKRTGGSANLNNPGQGAQRA